MKKLFSEAEVEFTLLSAVNDILFLSGNGSDLGDAEDGWDEG